MARKQLNFMCHVKSLAYKKHILVKIRNCYTSDEFIDKYLEKKSKYLLTKQTNNSNIYLDRIQNRRKSK